MPQHWNEKVAEAAIGLLRRPLTNQVRKLADHVVERVPAISALYEQVGPNNATDILNTALELLPDPDTRTVSGKGKDLAKDLTERFISRLQEALDAGGGGSTAAPGADITPDARGNLFKLFDPTVAGRRREFIEFLALLTPRQKKVAIEFILGRDIVDVQAFLGLPIEERMAFIWALIPRTQVAEVERIESEIRVRWTYAERFAEEEGRLHKEVVRLRSFGLDEAADAMRLQAAAHQAVVMHLVAPLVRHRDELLRLKRIPASDVATATGNFFQRLRAWDKRKFGEPTPTTP